MTTSKRGDVTIIALIVFGFAFLIFAVALVMLGFLPSSGAKDVFGRSDGNVTLSGQAYDCSGVAKVPKEYMPYIKTAADRFLGGDQAMLIALVSVEAGSWDPKSVSSGGAVGLGQFTAPTAREYQFKGAAFYGLKIITVPRADKSKRHFVTSAERQFFRANFSYSGRFQPGPSIAAIAEHLSVLLRNNGPDLGFVYAKYYHGYGNDGSQKDLATTVGQRLVSNYNKLKNGGGCTAKDPKTNTIDKVSITKQTTTLLGK